MAAQWRAIRPVVPSARSPFPVPTLAIYNTTRASSLPAPVCASIVPHMGGVRMTELAPLDSAVLPAGVRSRFVPDINGLRVHMLEAGSEGRPCVLLLHGFPELAYSWRHVMPALAE